MFTPKANSKQKRVKKTQEHEEKKVCCYRVTRRGELEASKHCSLSKSTIFNPKNPIFINLNPKTDWKPNL